jgi:hypothetical protein
VSMSAHYLISCHIFKGRQICLSTKQEAWYFSELIYRREKFRVGLVNSKNFSTHNAYKAFLLCILFQVGDSWSTSTRRYILCHLLGLFVAVPDFHLW